MHPNSLAYLQSRIREGGVLPVLQGLGAVLADQVEPAQLRALVYLAGRDLGRRQPLGRCETLEDVERLANERIGALDWGWLRIEAGAADVHFVHGCAPLRSWFGDDSMSWSGALLEGLYSEWLQSLGAGEQLDLRQVGGASGPDDVLRYRLAHQHQFEQG